MPNYYDNGDSQDEFASPDQREEMRSLGIDPDRDPDAYRYIEHPHFDFSRKAVKKQPEVSKDFVTEKNGQLSFAPEAEQNPFEPTPVKAPVKTNSEPSIHFPKLSPDEERRVSDQLLKEQEDSEYRYVDMAQDEGYLSPTDEGFLKKHPEVRNLMERGNQMEEAYQAGFQAGNSGRTF